MPPGDVFRNRKFYLLAGLLLLVVIVNFVEWRRSTTPGAANPKTKQAKNDRTMGDPVLLADMLREERKEFQEEKRNIFAFYHASPPAPSESEVAAAEPPPPPDPVCGNSVCENGENLETCPNDCQPPPPPAPVINLRYIGYLSERDGSVAFLTDGKEVYMGRVNDVIANQYRVLKITEDNVELGFLNNNQSSTIRFQGNQGG